ncbi:MAG: hypothetical protein WC538_16010 [Thermoanaerobaculia bacterium]
MKKRIEPRTGGEPPSSFLILHSTFFIPVSSQASTHTEMSNEE